MNERKTMPCYPWAVPTQEQMWMFDALSYEEQLKMVQNALIEGENSGKDSPLDMKEIREKARAEIKAKSLKR